MDDLFGHDEPDEPREPGEDTRCSPELLREFVQACLDSTGQYPTLQQIKSRFGGLLNAYVYGWQLKAEGRWPKRKAK